MLIPTNGEFGWSVGGCATLKVPQNERLVESKGGNSVFLSCIA